MPDFTPTEQKILNTLADGRPHSIDELMQCLWDELSARSAIFKHIHSIRRKLEPHGQYIRCLEPTPFHPLSYMHVTKTTCIVIRNGK
jgi:DNA-binding response OmpR family regulator